MTKAPLKNDWKPSRLGDYFRIRHGYAFKGEFFADDGPYVVLTPGNFRPDGGIKLKGDKEKYYTGDFPNEFLLKKDDLLIVMTDLTQNAPILGSPAFIPKNEAFLHNQRLGKIVELRDEEFDPRFLYHLFNYRAVRDQIKASATGATVKHTAPERIYAVQIQLPPLPVQRKISTILCAYDNLVENNTRRIAILEEMARAIYREWFINFRFPGHERVKMVESGTGKLPSGWEIRSIGEIIVTTGGGTPATKNPDFWEGGDIIWFTPSDLTAAGEMLVSESAKKITKTGLQNSSARLFPPYSVMMTSRATIGVISINTKEACTNQGFITCIPNNRLSACHIYFWIEHNREKIISIASGATYKEINRTEFRELPIALPDQELETQFTKLLDPVTKEIENLLNKNLNLRRTRDLLLPKLMSGQLDVDKLDISISELEEAGGTVQVETVAP